MLLKADTTMTATDQNWWTVHRTKLTGGPMVYLAANLSKADAIALANAEREADKSGEYRYGLFCIDYDAED